MISLDQENAFNLMCRVKADLARKRFPELLPMFRMHYSTGSPLLARCPDGSTSGL